MGCYHFLDNHGDIHSEYDNMQQRIAKTYKKTQNKFIGTYFPKNYVCTFVRYKINYVKSKQNMTSSFLCLKKPNHIEMIGKLHFSQNWKPKLHYDVMQLKPVIVFN